MTPTANSLNVCLELNSKPDHNIKNNTINLGFDNRINAYLVIYPLNHAFSSGTGILAIGIFTLN
ncbi:hypothetical protein A9Q75_06835 [Colwellia psychrerythraea]|uniref:Uncharacterized protein n=1 Tax=Colwellia psychrerythraea TaxID=28229 RepID=A0A1Y5EN25_COLPS|nr:hypothetical protein A9Q75_06835 [Colwellia psychrerythraea]